MINPTLKEYYITNTDKFIRYLITFYIPAFIIVFKSAIQIWNGIYDLDQIVYIYLFIITTIRTFTNYLKKDTKKHDIVSVESYYHKVLFWFGLKDSPEMENAIEKIEDIEKKLSGKSENTKGIRGFISSII